MNNDNQCDVRKPVGEDAGRLQRQNPSKPLPEPFDLEADLAELHKSLYSRNFGAGVDKNDSAAVTRMNARFNVFQSATQDMVHYREFINLVAMLSLTQPNFDVDVAASKCLQASAATLDALLDALGIPR